MTDPDYKGNGKGEGWMPVFRIFRFLFNRNTWVESNPVTGEDEPIDRQDVIDDLDINESEEGNGENRR